MSTLQELKSAAVLLPESDRQELAQFILNSLDQEMTEQVRREWITLAIARLDEIRMGLVVGIPADEVLAKMPGGRS